MAKDVETKLIDPWPIDSMAVWDVTIKFQINPTEYNGCDDSAETVKELVAECLKGENDWPWDDTLKAKISCKRAKL